MPHVPRPIDPQAESDAFFADLLRLILDAFAGMEGRIDPPSSAHALTPTLLRRKAALEQGFVIEAGGKPVACLFCKAEPPDTLYLGKLAVDPHWLGKGFGRQLLAAAERTALSRGLTRLRLETRIELVENHAVFSAWGFTRTAENSHDGYDRITSVEMCKLMENLY